MKPKIAINGFGRIGRVFFRTNLERDLVDIVGINDLTPPKTLAHLLKYDSTYGISDAEIGADEKNLIVNGRKIPVAADRDPANLPWKNLGVDLVVECTGAFTERDGAAKHLIAGAKRVIISAPAKNPDVTLVLGVNFEKFDSSKHFVLSMASCTTGSLAPVVKVLHETFGIERGLMTTIHSYTNDQAILDQSHKDLRRARAAAVSVIPTTTGAAKAIGEVIPELNGKLNGVSVRVPTPSVSLTDFVCVLRKSPTRDEVNAALKKAASGAMKGILDVCDLPLVSIDYRKNPHSSIVDSEQTQVIDNLVKIFAWYDNEWGYSMRLLELASKVGAV